MSQNFDSNTITTPHPDTRPLICVRGARFDGSKDCVATITQSFKAHFVGPWPTFSDVPKDVKDLWFQKFSGSYRWAAEDTALIRKTWEKICRTRLSDMLHRARRECTDSSPSWIDAAIWAQLLSHWSTEGFKSKSASASRNRKVGPTHTGGSISFSEHESRAQKEHGPTSEYSDIFRRLHVFQSGPNKGEFINERSKNVMEEYTRLKEQYSRISSSSGSVGSSSIPTDKELLLEASGGFQKGRAYGLGSEASALKAQLEPVTSPDERETELQKLREEVRDLREKQEEFTNYLKEIAKQVGTSSSSIPPVPSSLIEDDDDTLPGTPP